MQDVMKELGALKRQRDLVNASILTDGAKAKLLQQIAARVAEISAQLEKADIAAQGAAKSVK